MEKNTVIFVTDQRQQAISQFLPGKVQTLRWKSEEEENQCLKAIQRANVVVLPTPVNKIYSATDLVEILKYNLINCKTLFGGKLDDLWYDLARQQGFLCCDFMKMEDVACENARITAQATVAEILKYSSYEIDGQKIVITGFGKCAREIAKYLFAMGAKITILARSSKDRKLAKDLGYSAVDFSYAPEEAYGTHIYVNTVPALVVKENWMKEMHADAVIIDIASKPGGCDVKAAERYHIPVIAALSLPGKYVTKSGAGVFAKAIYKNAFLDFNVKEDTSWISQIII